MSRSDLWENIGKAIAYVVLIAAVCLTAYWLQVHREERLISYLLDEIQRRGMAPQAVPK